MANILSRFAENLPDPEVTAEPDASDNLAALLPEARALASGLASDGPLAFAFGQWAEASRLAALAGHADYFDDRSVRTMPGAISKGETIWPGEVQRRLVEVEKLLGKGLGTTTMEQLGNAFEGLVEHASSNHASSN